MTGILGKKVGMTRVIADDGGVIPVSVIECSPNEIIHIKTTEKDGYPALVLGFDELKKPKKTCKFRHLAEFKIENNSEVKKGEKVSVANFQEIKTVKIIGTSKGKGTAGVIKRHNFSRGPETHGSHHHRQPGSNAGTVTGTGRTPKGKKFPGRMGNAQVTKKNIPIVSVDIEKNLLVVKGPIPGSIGSLVKVEAC
jgi:large subunit ribosomal protein L3